MPAKQVLNIRILTGGGMWDMMSEHEASFLLSAFGIFRNVRDAGRGMPRASAELVRFYNPTDFYRSVSAPADILHLISHGTGTEMQAGGGGRKIKATEVAKRGASGKLQLPEVVVSTACGFQSVTWQDALRDAGVKILIGSGGEPTPANLAAFDMAFYAALLSQVRKNRTTLQRVRDSFAVANRYYRAVHAAGTAFSKFQLVNL